MSFEGIDHIAIAVKSLDEAVEPYRELLQVDPHFETVQQQGIRVAAFEIGNGRVELIEPMEEDSPIAQYIRKHGEGIHHVALRSDDVEEELNRVTRTNLEQIDTEPRDGAEGYRIGFLHPKSTHGALIELAQPPGD